MQIAVDHTTVYRYSERVSRSTQYLRLTPPSGVRQKVLRWELELPGRSVSLRDAFDNLTHVLTMDSPYEEVRLRAHGVVEVGPAPEEAPLPGGTQLINPMVFLRSTPLTEADQSLRDFAEGIGGLGAGDRLRVLEQLMARILERMPYRRGSTSVSHSAPESFALGAGVCQDHTHVFISCARLLGIPARYVSGYVDPRGEPEAASHAWAQAWVDGRWRSFDVSNGRPALAGHVLLAVGRDYLDACPVRGVRTGGGDESLGVTAIVKVLDP
jgi:transglutaminase-like putative cysteine protease